MLFNYSTMHCKIFIYFLYIYRGIKYVFLIFCKLVIPNVITSFSPILSLYLSSLTLSSPLPSSPILSSTLLRPPLLSCYFIRSSSLLSSPPLCYVLSSPLPSFRLLHPPLLPSSYMLRPPLLSSPLLSSTLLCPPLL